MFSLYNCRFRKSVIRSVMLFISALLAFVLFLPCITHSVRAEGDGEQQFRYLSELTDLEMKRKSVAWGSYGRDKNPEGNRISVYIDGVKTYFDYGIGAHAQADLFYDLGSGSTYNRFTGYVGIDGSRTGTSEAAVYISVSNDMENWEEIFISGTLNANKNAEYVDKDISGYRYFRIFCDPLGANSADHTVIADAKLYFASGERPGCDVISPIDTYSSLLAGKSTSEIMDDPDLRLAAMRRMLLEKIGDSAYDTITLYFLPTDTSGSRLEMLQWLLNDANALEEFLGGGDPDGGSYLGALDVLARLYAEYKDDLEDETELFEPESGSTRNRGDLYQTVMFAIALTHDTAVRSWLNNSITSDPVERYAAFKETYLDPVNHLRWDIYENLVVEEMRYVMGVRIYNDEIHWLNAYCRATPSSSSGGTSYPLLYSPHHHMRYGKDWDYEAKGLKKEENYSTYDAKYNLSAYGIEYTTLHKLWMVFEGSHICWGISYVGTNHAAAFGVPSHYCLQPGHAAFFIYSRNEKNQGVWGIDNNIYGWTKTLQSETVWGGCNRMLCNWGTYYNGWSSYWSGTYLLLAQHALDHDTYDSTRVMLSLVSLADTDDEKEQIYRDVLDVMPYQLDAWYGLVKLYTNGNKSAGEMASLAKELCENMYKFPLPMYDLIALLRAAASGSSDADATVQLAAIISYEEQALNRATGITSANTDLAKPGEAVAEANYLLSSFSGELASFSFDGENAGELVFDGTYAGARYTYSLDGGNTWIYNGEDPWLTSESNLTHEFTTAEIEQLTAENDILIWLEGWASDNNNQPTAEGAFKIDISKGSAVSGVEANDNENRFLGSVSAMEYSVDGQNWLPLTDNISFAGNQTVSLRRRASGKALAGDSSVFEFTDNNTQKRSYIDLTRITLSGYSSEEGSHNDWARYAIDGLLSTRWHTKWSGGDSARYLTVKVDEPTYFTGVDYVGVGGNGTVYSCNVYVSMDGVNWYLAGTASGWTNDTVRKRMTFEPAYGQYIKFVGVNTVGGFCAAKSLEFFEDTTLKNKTAVGIQLDATPTKKSYSVGESASLDGLSLKLVFDDKSTASVPFSAVTVEPAVFYETGVQKVKLSYASLAPVTYDVTVSPLTGFTPTTLEITSPASRTVYYTGDSVSDEGLVVKATDGTKSITLQKGEYTLTADTSQPGAGTASITYAGISVTYGITVKKAIESITVSSLPENRTYQLGQELDTEGLAATVTYTDETTEVLTYESGAIVIPNLDDFSESPGKAAVLVAVADRQSVKTSFEVEVYPYFTVGNITYELSDTDSGTANRTCYVISASSGDGSFVSVPEAVRAGSVTYTVTGVETGAFTGELGITELALPATIDHVSSGAFTGLVGLEKIYLTAYNSFEGLTVADDAFSETTSVCLYAADEELQNELAEQLREKPFAESIVIDDISGEISSISATQPDKTEYIEGEKLNLTGLSVSAVLNNGNIVPINISTCTVDEPEMTTFGEKAVTVSLTESPEIYTTFKITVLNTTLRITAQPESAVYYNAGETAKPLTVEVFCSVESVECLYKWYCSTDGVIDHERDKLEGEVGSTITPTVSGFYYVNVYTASGSSVWSMTASIDFGDYVAITGGKGYETLKAAFEAVAPGGEITLVKDATASSTITLTKSVILNGNGHTVSRDSGFLDSFVIISGTGSLSVTDTIFDGGAVWTGSVNETLQRGTVNSGINANRPVFYLQDNASLYLGYGSVIRNNCNSYTNTGDRPLKCGGAITAHNNAKVDLNGALIENNYSYIFGGAIYSRDTTALTIRGGTIIRGNSGSTQWNTSAICADNSCSTTVDGATFANNMGTAKGGAFWVCDGAVSLKNAIFTGNSAAEGSGIYIHGSAALSVGEDCVLEEMYRVNTTSGIRINVGTPKAHMVLYTAQSPEKAAEALQSLVLEGISDAVTYIDGSNICLLAGGCLGTIKRAGADVTLNITGTVAQSGTYMLVTYDRDTGKMLKTETITPTAGEDLTCTADENCIVKCFLLTENNTPGALKMLTNETQ